MNIPDTFGWDTVFAISIDKVNEYLASAAPSDSFSAQQDVTGGIARVDWSFENWRITDTPAGSKIEITLDFGPGSTLTRPDGGGTKTIELDSPEWSCVVIFEAHFDDTDPETQRLVAKTATGQPWASVRIESSIPDTSTRIVLQSLLTRWFREAPEAVQLFEQEFATVNVGELVAGEGLGWLTPQVVAFAGGVMADQVTKALGILTMTGTDKAEAEARASQATLQLSPFAIPANATSGFIFSARVFLLHMLMPACAGTFGGDEKNPTKHLEIYGDGTPQLRNHTALAFKEEVDGAQRDAHIKAEGLNFSFEGERLRMRIAQNVGTSFPGYSLDAKIEEAYVAVLMDKPEATGETVFLLANDGYRAPEIDVVREPWVTGLQLAGDIAALLLASLAAAFMPKSKWLKKTLKLSSKGAKILSKIIGGVIAAVVLGLLANIPSYIESALQGEVHRFPDFGKFLNKAYLDRIGWPGRAKVQFTPTAVRFANGLQIAIEPA